MAGSYITFLPHLIREFFAVADSAIDSDHLSGSLDLLVEQDSSGETVNQPLQFRGPGDILGIHPRMIARIEPPPGTNDFEPNYFPFLEFVDPDLLWRYSLEPTGTKTRAHPWLSLLALSSKEFDEIASSGVEVISRIRDDRELLSVPGHLIPDLDDAWALAHVHLNGELAGDDVGEFVEQQPAASYCRLFCARYLQPETQYYALLVPNYRAALDAAMGINDSTAGSAKAWDGSDQDIVRLPIYLRWEFKTSEKGDFEDLARKLTAAPVNPGRVGTRPVDATKLRTGNGEAPYFVREGALAPPGFSTFRSPELPVPSAVEPLRKSLNKSLSADPQETDDIAEDVDPLVTFPIYGRYYQHTAAIEPPESGSWDETTPWIRELNLDFRNRTAASMGTTVVQQNQDDYVRQCWAQVGQIREANELRRLSLTAYVIGKAIEAKHLTPLSDEKFVEITRAFHEQLFTDESSERRTFKQALQQSGLVAGSFSPTLARVAKQRIGANKTRPYDPWTKARPSRAAPQLRKTHRITKDQITAAFNLVGIEDQVLEQHAELISVQPLNLNTNFRSMVDLNQALVANLADRIHTTTDDDDSGNFEPIMRAPVVDDATYAPLAKISQDYILPGVEALQNNGVTLMEENHRFIEAFMTGVNHEMVRELVWERFPTDKRATVFRYFWDPVVDTDPHPDIQVIHRWQGPLGKNEAVHGGSNLVLVIKGDLIRRYPGTIIYAVRLSSRSAEGWQYWSDIYPDHQPPEIDDDVIISPVFRAHIGTDILFAGFPFALDDVQGPTKNGQYYFVLEENQDLPRFGLDVQSIGVRKPNLVLSGTFVIEATTASEEAPPSTVIGSRFSTAGSAITDAGFTMAGVTTAEDDQTPSGDLGWNDIPADHLKADYINRFNNVGKNSAEVALRTYQKPIRILVHASHVLAQKDTE